MVAPGNKDRDRFDYWQNAAVDAWERAGRAGIVEAVTGSGKTHVAYKAIERLNKVYGRDLYPLIVVPTIPLMDQWKTGLEEVFDGARVGLQGNSHSDTFATFRDGKPVRAIVSTIHSAVNSLKNGLLAHCLAGGGRTAWSGAGTSHSVRSGWSRSSWHWRSRLRSRAAWRWMSVARCSRCHTASFEAN